MSKHSQKFRKRRLIALLSAAVISISTIYFHQDFWKNSNNQSAQSNQNQSQNISYSEELNSLHVKGRAPKTGYSRDQFGKGWQKDSSGCDTRNRILKRDLKNTTENDKCQILTGELNDPYTSELINFSRASNPSEIQIDHVVALSDAWQKGAQALTPEQRTELANNSLNLLAVSGKANQQKSDSDAASWLPANKNFRCQYVQRQISVKKKYNLWVTQAEKEAMQKNLQTCPQ